MPETQRLHQHPRWDIQTPDSIVKTGRSISRSLRQPKKAVRFRPDPFNILAPDLKEIPYLTAVKTKNPSCGKLHNEDLILQAEDLLAILNKFTDFKDDREWTGEECLVDVMEYLIGKLRELVPEGVNFSLLRDVNDQYGYDKSYEHYHVALYQWYDTYSEDRNSPVEFLRFLADDNRYLHDVALDTMVLLSHNRGIECFNDIQYYMEIDEQISNAEDEEDYAQKFSLEYWKEEFENGTVSFYVDYFKNARPQRKFILKRLKNVCPNNELELWLVSWLYKALDLSKGKGKISKYSEYPDDKEVEFMAVTPQWYYRFCWSYKDAYAQAHSEYIDIQANEGGVIPFVAKAYWSRDKIDSWYMPKWPVKLDYLFNEALDLFTTLVKFYFKRWITNYMKPSTNLLIQ